MMMYRYGASIFCVAAVVTLAGQAASEDSRGTSIALSADRADCLAATAALFLSKGLAARPISVASCPDIASRQEIASKVTQNGLFQPTLNQAEVVDDDSVIIFSRRQLECLRDHYAIIRDASTVATSVGEARKVISLRFERCP